MRWVRVGVSLIALHTSVVAAADPQAVVRLSTLSNPRANQATGLLSTADNAVTFVQPDVSSAIQRVGRTAQSFDFVAGYARSAGQPDADLRLVSAVGLPGELVCAYVRGGTRKTTLTALLLFNTQTHATRTLVVAADFAAASGMGDSLDLADAQFATAGPSVWLWLRHVDRSVFFRFDARQLAGGDARLARPFQQLVTGDEPLKLGNDVVMTGRPDGGFWLLDRGTPAASGNGSGGVPAKLWKVDDQGQATSGDWPVDALSPPSVPPLPLGDGPDAPQLYFYARPRGLDPLMPAAVETRERFPVFEIRRRGAASRLPLRLDRDAIEVRAGFPLYALRLTAWTRDAATGDVIAYDRMSGDVLRITLPPAR